MSRWSSFNWPSFIGEMPPGWTLPTSAHYSNDASYAFLNWLIAEYQSQRISKCLRKATFFTVPCYASTLAEKSAEHVLSRVHGQKYYNELNIFSQGRWTMFLCYEETEFAGIYIFFIFQQIAFDKIVNRRERGFDSTNFCRLF